MEHASIGKGVTVGVPQFLKMAVEDVKSAHSKDPAAKSLAEVALTYPGLHAVWGYRLAHELWERGWRLPARILQEVTRMFTGVDIHPAAILGRRVFIDHATGIVIGETAEVGDDVLIYHGVTLGGVTLNPGKRHPTIGDRVVIGAGAKVLGAIYVGADSRIGANAVVVKDVPANSVAIGVPAASRQICDLPHKCESGLMREPALYI